MNRNLNSQAREQALKDIQNDIVIDIKCEPGFYNDFYTVGITRLRTKANRKLNSLLGIV
jgi:hypothetical protein